eukprot:CAMPEP_0202703782 /NCGR_PEP_ID=MMETSP1385-20130828/16583_1 /ASSEMBLY_ACC=CAM_ASM_000861 /TAXON_ID=933848 /ORGANISM="Elphidium margaritaceum" /LENGTH=200 /DNA_ID=CAMNT_0049361685 /DNA_START=36 /DNA_END=638 /DNA_ORIENTATION=-
MSSSLIISVLLLCISFIEILHASNFRLSGQLQGLPEDISPSIARIFMDGGKQIAIPTKNGKFVFRDLPVGDHSMEIHMNGYEWYTYVVDVRADGKIRAYLHGQKEALPPQLIIMPARMAKYVPDRKPWNPLNLLKSGPGIMIAIMLVTTVILPKMMEGMDPQAMMAEAQQEAVQGQTQTQSAVQSGNSGNASQKSKGKRK